MDKKEIRRRFQEALDRGGNTHTIEDITAALKAGEMQIFFTKDEQAFLITQIGVHPRKKIMYFFLCFGDMTTGDNARELHEQAITRARELGCSSAHIEGRDGWAKHLPAYGWRKESICFRLDLEPLDSVIP